MKNFLIAKMTYSNRKCDGAFTLIELLAVIVILGILASILLSAIINQRKKSHSAACLSNLQQLSQAIQMYRSDYDGCFPVASFSNDNIQNNDTIWSDEVSPYVKNQHMKCLSSPKMPDVRDQMQLGYSFNGLLNTEPIANTTKNSGVSETSLDHIADIVVLLEARPGIISSYQPDTAGSIYIVGIARLSSSEIIEFGATRHFEGANYAFADGHVKWHTPADFSVRREGKPRFR